MDPTTFIFFLLTGICLVGLWARHWALAARVAKTELQMGRFVSDIESEKETRRRSNRDINSRIRHLEGLKPIPFNDNQTES